MGEPADTLVGTVLDGRYRVTRSIARGGMATVYEAVDTRLDRVVAVKVMHPALAEDKDFVERFIREARSAARLSHPNVVSVFDQSADSGSVFLAMEHVEGRTLRDWLREKHRLTPRETFAVMEPVLAALAAAHQAGLVHRDIKPENVLIADDGRVKVADFGLARAVTAGSQTATWGAPTGTNTLIGTVAYLSPEQVEKGHADHRSDVYAAGILLYECLTGLQPFSGDSPIQVAYQHVHYDVPRPSDARPTLPPVLDSLVLRATARDPAARPADAGAFLAETVAARRALRPEVLDDVAGSGLPVPAPAPAAGSPTLAFGAVPPGLAAGPHAVTEQIARGGAPTGPGPNGPPAARPPGEGVPYPVPARLQHRRRRGVLALLAVLVTTFAVGIGAWQVAVGSSVSTPSLLNLTAEAAEAKAQEAGLTVNFVGEEFDETVPKGLVLRTDPAPGRKVAENGTITAVLSKGPERYFVPELAGETVGSAERRLEEGNLTAADKHAEKYSDTVPAGKVIGSEPAAGKELRRDAVVKLVVSKGPKPLAVPNVVGKNVDEASQLLIQAGFKVTVVEELSDSAPDGVVLEQNPPAGGRKVPKGTTIELVVAKSDLIEVPRVIGMNIDDAEELLEGLGFDVDRSGLPFGDRVVSQDPDPGERVPRGSTVTLRVF